MDEDLLFSMWFRYVDQIVVETSTAIIEIIENLYEDHLINTSKSFRQRIGVLIAVEGNYIKNSNHIQFYIL